MVYVLDQNGQPMMPTDRHRKVRLMLQSGRAKVVRRCPFTIQLNYESGHQTQEISLGIDAGSKHIGVSATTKTRVLYEADVELRNDIVNLLSSRRELRCGRRNRKTRHRKARFNNRKRPDGWLAPSIRQKIETHLIVVRNVCRILPVSSITVETASFDIQKIKNPGIQGTEFQQGEQLAVAALDFQRYPRKRGILTAQGNEQVQMFSQIKTDRIGREYARFQPQLIHQVAHHSHQVPAAAVQHIDIPCAAGVGLTAVQTQGKKLQGAANGLNRRLEIVAYLGQGG